MGGLGQTVIDKSNKKFTTSKDFNPESLGKDKAKRDALAEKQTSI
jgi:hypothetical protein